MQFKKLFTVILATAMIFTCGVMNISAEESGVIPDGAVVIDGELFIPEEGEQFVVIYSDKEHEVTDPELIATLNNQGTTSMYAMAADGVDLSGSNSYDDSVSLTSGDYDSPRFLLSAYPNLMYGVTIKCNKSLTMKMTFYHYFPSTSKWYENPVSLKYTLAIKQHTFLGDTATRTATKCEFTIHKEGTTKTSFDYEI